MYIDDNEEKQEAKKQEYKTNIQNRIHQKQRLEK